MASLAFFGSPQAAAVSLRALVEAGHDVRLVVTRPEARRARRASPEPTAVGALAAQLGLPVGIDPQEAAAVGAELGVVVAYGRLLRPPLLERLPLVNVHFSLLPRWRGAAPVEWALRSGDAETGVSLMRVEPSLDTGPVYAARRLAIGEDLTAEELRAALADLGAQLLVERLSRGLASLGEPVAQSGEPTWAPPLSSEDRRLSWERPAAELHRLVRAGRAWTTLEGQRLLVRRSTLAGAGDGPGAPAGLQASGSWEAGARPGALMADATVLTGDGRLRLVEVQLAGRRPTAAGAWMRGLARETPLLLGT